MRSIASSPPTRHSRTTRTRAESASSRRERPYFGWQRPQWDGNPIGAHGVATSRTDVSRQPARERDTAHTSPAALVRQQRRLREQPDERNPPREHYVFVATHVGEVDRTD